MRLARHDVLFEPIEIRGKRFRNRFYSVPHGSFHPGRRLSDIAFRRMKAEGGWAAVCGGVVSIHEESWGGFVPRSWDEVDRDVLHRMSDEIKGQGALSGVEFGHGGARGEGAKFWPGIGATQRADPDRGRVVPKEMDLDDIRRVQDDYVRAAGLAADMGYDIVYAYGAHGYLPGQFLSPWFNRRTDAYGGSLENRARFWLEIIDRFRTEVGDRCLIAVRIAAEQFSPFGVSAEEALEFVGMADDLVDLWDVNVGLAWAQDSAEWRVAAEGFQVEYSRRFRERTTKPIVGVSRLTTPDTMAEILRAGWWDFIGGARPGIADPFLPRKVEQGRYDDIRECTGSNFCIAVETSGAGLSCVQNPTIGEEYRRAWHPERFAPLTGAARNILVVGAGPAGMECARVLGERGANSVHVVDERPELGGHVTWLRTVPGLGGIGRVVDHRSIQLAKLSNVVGVTGRRLDIESVLDYGADAVVVATGARWIGPADDALEPALVDAGRRGATVVTPDEAMAAVALSGPILVWDGEGSGVGSGVAEWLATGGVAVAIATPFDVVAPWLDGSFAGPTARQRLHDLGVEMRCGVRPSRAMAGGLALLDRFGAEVEVAAATIVVASQRHSDDRLFRALRCDPARLADSGVRVLVRVGDCVAPRPLGFTVADGHRVGRELDAAAPAVPVAPRRERDHDAPTALFDRTDEHAG
jgi:dimethylamine/trimethylamine dehydrogenase